LTKEIKAERKALMDVPEVIEAEKRCNQINVKLTKPLIRKWKDAHGLDKSYVLGEAETDAVIEWRRKQLWKPFNFRSSKQKQVLFLQVMGLPVEKLTARGNPEISKKTLHAYGNTGKRLLSMLLKMKELDECLALMELSEYDGKLHASLRSGSTVSGRSSSRVD
jgi:DNA polymerase I-like protein with 3'-5' exonuclease and polymerase domains